MGDEMEVEPIISVDVSPSSAVAQEMPTSVDQESAPAPAEAAAAPAAEAEAEESGPAAPSAKKRRAAVVSHDIRGFFDGSRPAAPPMPVEFAAPAALMGASLSKAAGGAGGAEAEDSGSLASAAGGSGNIVLAAFKLSKSACQEIPGENLAPVVLEFGRSELAGPAELGSLSAAVPLLTTATPLLPSGQAIFGQLPPCWVEATGRSDALGTRCFFASRRHEHSVFEPLQAERLLKVPAAATAWQPSLSVPSASEGSIQEPQLADQEPWSVQLHPGRKELRVLVRPGVLLQRMLRRGAALPAARFTWRIVDASASSEQGIVAQRAGATDRPFAASSMVGEFSILSNVEDAAHTQPPNFAQWPLRREQLRSLGWMMLQEQRRSEPFVTELRECVSCPDAPHWRLEGCLRCEYQGVKGGVLADAIGYGKTACAIGLINCTMKLPLSQIPSAFSGFIPSRATLVLAPTNLHSQWLAEITKFTDKTFKILSVPTCSQLKRLTVRDLAEADVVVATYRLFYSSPYLRRLQEVARTQRPGFVFPRMFGVSTGEAGPSAASASGGGNHKAYYSRATADWAHAYRGAFDVLPAWARGLPDAAARGELEAGPPPAFEGPVTPAKSASPAAKSSAKAKGASAKAAAQAVTGVKQPAEDLLSTQKVSAGPRGRRVSAASTPDGGEDGEGGKRRRLLGKQAVALPPPEWSQQPKPEAKATKVSTGTGAAGTMFGRGVDSSEQTRFVPLEAFWWRRVICDEFHELLSRYPPAQVAVELFHGDYKWGLSGTPPCQTLAQIRKAAGFLGVQLPTAAAEESGGEAPRQVAQEWLDAFVRRNTSELPPLEEEERIVPVQQTPKERALYLALTEQQAVLSTQAAAESAQALEENPGLLAAKRSASGLLKLCSHFCASATSDEATAEDECRRQLALRHERVRAAERDAKALADRAASTASLVRHFEPAYGGLGVGAGGSGGALKSDYDFLLQEPRAAIAARLRFLLGGSSVPSPAGAKVELLVKLWGPISSAEVGGEIAKASSRAREAVLRPCFDAKRDGKAARLLPADEPSAWASLEEQAAVKTEVHEKGKAKDGEDLVLEAVRRALEACPRGKEMQQLPARCSKLRTHLGMPKWPGPRESPNDLLLKANWEWLRDRSNSDKLREVVESWKADVQSCASQLETLKAEATTRLASLKSFQQSLDDPQVVADCEAIVETSAPLFAKYGSKIEKLVGHVQRLRQEDPTCKVICFVQWEDLKRRISAALEEFGVEHLSLKGSVWARRSALTQFQYEESSPKMLLLSLEESASGTNLTAANHVIIVHPMEAATKEEAVAFEMQAVGRVRRPGQQRKIHIWRFVTVGTIEQQITEEHQRELWERQRAKVEVSRPAPLGEDALRSDDEGLEADEAEVVVAGDVAPGAAQADPLSSAGAWPTLSAQPTGQGAAAARGTDDVEAFEPTQRYLGAASSSSTSVPPPRRPKAPSPPMFAPPALEVPSLSPAPVAMAVEETLPASEAELFSSENIFPGAATASGTLGGLATQAY